MGETGKELRKIDLDDGYYFGLGVFETIAVRDGRPLFLKEHLERLVSGMDFLKIGLSGRKGQDFGGRCPEEKIRREVRSWLQNRPFFTGALKIIVSEKNFFLEGRNNPYTKGQYETGLTAAFSQVRRNSTSPFTYLKSLNYGDSILEKRKAAEKKTGEVVFLNERGEICEGAVSNLFFVKRDDSVWTPSLSCGLLPGVVRRVLLERGLARETVIRPEDLDSVKEVFLTNSLMGVMPMTKLNDLTFPVGEVTKQMMQTYAILTETESV